MPPAATPDPAPLLALAEDARAAGRALEAAAALRALSALVPGDARVRAALARALFQAGLWNEAWAAYEVRFDLLPSAFPRVTRPEPDGPVPLAAFAPLAAVPGVRLFSLQKGPGEEQDAPFPLDRLGPEMDGDGDWFLDTAAAIEALDLVVAVDTAVLHLAGALGRPALMLMHGRSADWRWLHAQDVPVWYPSVRLVRCPDGNADWRGAVARAAFLVRTGNLPAVV